MAKKARPNRNTRQHQPHQDEKPTDHGKPNAGEHASPASNSAEPSLQATEHQTAEKRFWERQIRAATVLNFLTGIAGAVGIVGLIFIYLSFEESKRAGKEAAYSTEIATKVLLRRTGPGLAPDS
jgi:hypothetical protein